MQIAHGLERMRGNAEEAVGGVGRRGQHPLAVQAGSRQVVAQDLGGGRVAHRLDAAVSSAWIVSA